MHEKRIYFIVDDDRIFIKFLTKYLASDLLTIASSTTSSDALREIIRLKPDCLILDIMMPDIDGFELCKQVRAEPGLDNTKIVVVTGAGSGIGKARRRREGRKNSPRAGSRRATATRAHRSAAAGGAAQVGIRVRYQHELGAQSQPGIE